MNSFELKKNLNAISYLSLSLIYHFKYFCQVHMEEEQQTFLRELESDWSAHLHVSSNFLHSNRIFLAISQLLNDFM